MTDGKGRAIMAHGRILFINASQKRDGNTVEYAQALLDGLDFERIDLVDYRMGFFGQDFADDQFEEVFQKMVESDTIVLGSPVYSETMSAAARLLLEPLETPHPAGGPGGGAHDGMRSRGGGGRRWPFPSPPLLPGRLPF